MRRWPQPVARAAVDGGDHLRDRRFHEDGLADTGADSFGGGWDKPHAGEIMKDSRVGSYGVLALVLALLSKVPRLPELPRMAPGLASFCSPTTPCRASCSTVLLATMDYARERSAGQVAAGDPFSGGEMLVALFRRGCLAFLPTDECDNWWRSPPWRVLVVHKFKHWLGGY